MVKFCLGNMHENGIFSVYVNTHLSIVSRMTHYHVSWFTYKEWRAINKFLRYVLQHNHDRNFCHYTIKLNHIIMIKLAHYGSFLEES